MDHLQSCSSLLPTCCQISLKGYGRAHHKQGKMSPELLKTPAAWCNTHQLIWQIRKYNTTCKVSFKKWNRWPHWRLWGIPKGSGISHTQCIYRFICKEETVLVHSAVQILSKCPTPNKSLPEIWTDREDVPKTPMDSSAEDPRPVLDDHSPAPAGGSSAPHYQGAQWESRMDLQVLPSCKELHRKPKHKDFWIGTFLNSGMQRCMPKCSLSLQPGTPLAELTCLTQWLGSVCMWCFWIPVPWQH